MPSARFNRWFLLFYLFLFALVIFWSYSEYQSRSQQIINSYRDQARLTANAITNSGIRQFDLSENLEQAYLDRAFTLLHTINKLDRDGRLTEDQLATLANRDGLFRIMFVNENGEMGLSAGRGPGPGYGMGMGMGQGGGTGFGRPRSRGTRGIVTLLEPILSGAVDSLILGSPGVGTAVGNESGTGESIHRTGTLSDGNRFMVAIAAFRGGAIVAQLSVDVETALRSQTDFKNLLDGFLDVEGVAFLQLVAQDQDTILTLPDSLGEQLALAEIQLIDAHMEYIDTPTNMYIQLHESVRLQNQPFDLSLGFRANEFDTLKHKLLLQILFRTVIFIILALVVTAFFISRQNAALLQAEKERMEAEVFRLERLQRIQEKQAAMGELAAGVAHEIRNPLNAIGILVQRIQRELVVPKNDPDGEWHKLTGTLRNEISRINSTLEEFLAFSRPTPLKRQIVKISQVFDEIKNLFGTQAENEQKHLNFELTDDPVVLGDHQYLHRALNNLVKNALEATSEGDTIILSAKPKKNGAAVEVQITDSGKGIAPENLNRVFDLFFSDKDHGSGIGLALVHKIINDHEGSIEVFSEIGRGTTFTIILPAARR